jgi:hypothetical protein
MDEPAVDVTCCCVTAAVYLPRIRSLRDREWLWPRSLRFSLHLFVTQAFCVFFFLFFVSMLQGLLWRPAQRAVAIVA